MAIKNYPSPNSPMKTIDINRKRAFLSNSTGVFVTPPRGISRSSPFSSGASNTFDSSGKRRMNFSSPLCSNLETDGVADRFIPDRSNFRVDLCRASMISAEKRRKAAEQDMIYSRGRENGDPNDRSPPPPSSRNTRSSGETLTPLQAEFRRRMRSALLSLPMDESGAVAGGGSRRNLRLNGAKNDANQQSSGMDHNMSMSSISSNDSMLNGSNLISSNIEVSNLSSRSLGSDLAYAPPPEVDDEDVTDTIGPGRSGKMLSFKSSRTPPRYSSSKSPSSIWVTPTPTKRSVHSSSISSLSPSTQDPFSHDQLRVLHRSASDRFSSTLGNSSIDSVILGDDGFRSVAKKVGRKIPTTPSRILDAPELVDDYYLNLVSWGSNNVLAVALGQRVYLWNADTGDINHLLTLHGEGDYVTSVSWSTKPGEQNLIAVGTNNAPVQV